MTETPPPGGPDATYFRYLESGDCRIQKCSGCGAHVFQPRVMCPACAGDALDWVVPSGDGTVYSTTVIRRRADRGGDYNVCLIDLAEGVRMMSRVEGMAPYAVTIGLPVSARLTDDDGAKIVVFDPVGDRS